MRCFDGALLDTLNQIHLNFIFSGHSTVDGSWRGRVDSPDYSRLYYVAGGAAAITTAVERVELIPGRWYLLPSGLSFDYECPDSLDHIFFHVKLCGVNGFDLLGKCGKVLFTEDDGTADRLAASDHRGLLGALGMRGIVLCVINLMLEKYGVCIEETSFSPCTTAAVKYINENPSFSLTPDIVAERAFVSKSTLDKHFRAELGTSVGKYIDDTVFSEALRLISASRLSIRDISERLGFSDQFYFSKKFKAKYGITPREYRKMPFA